MDGMIPSTQCTRLTRLGPTKVPTMDSAVHLEWLRREGELLASVPADGLDRPVEACPGWTVERLIGHVGRVHLWAASFLREGPDGGPADAGPRPPRGADIVPWYVECLRHLLDELGRHDPNEPSRSFAGPAPAAFWFRRQVHEVLVHGWDAQHAIDPAQISPVDAALAADGIDEWLAVFVQRRPTPQEGATPPGLLGASLHLHATEPAEALGGLGEWTLRLLADGCSVEKGHAKGDAAMRGAAADLLLTAWHRPAHGTVELIGDQARAREILELVHVT